MLNSCKIKFIWFNSDDYYHIMVYFFVAVIREYKHIFSNNKKTLWIIGIFYFYKKNNHNVTDNAKPDAAHFVHTIALNSLLKIN